MQPMRAETPCQPRFAGRLMRVRAIRRFIVRPVLPEALKPLGDLARNLRWCWHAETQDLFRSVDPQLWERTGGDPIRLLADVSVERLQALATDKRFLKNLRLIQADLAEYLSGDLWYQGYAAENPAAPVSIGYFSPEFGITEVLPQYSGGLGILAGDHLKAASDLGVPIIGVGLLYRQGYFRQSLNAAGWQQERYPLFDPNSLPLTLLHDDSGPIRIEVPLAGRTLFAQVWVAQVGRVPLLMLDSDVEQNAGYEREVTDRLYGGGTDHRLEQEVLLGMGGVRAIRAYCRISGHPSASGVPHQRGPCRIPGVGADSRIHAGRRWTSIPHWNAAARGPSSPLIPRFRPASTGSPAS